MNPSDRFTSPIVFPDGWRLVIERYTLHSAYHIELHGLMVPPVQQEVPLPEMENYDIRHETMQLQGCVMATPLRDDEE